MKTIFFSVAYPGVKEYLPGFMESLCGQTDKDFTLFLINDSLINANEILDQFNKRIKFEIRNAQGTPAELRKIGIEWCLSEGAEIIVFGDSDDYFEENRIKVSKQALIDHHIVFNELTLVGEDISNPVSWLNKRFDDGDAISLEHLLTANCMGLSNTAIKTKIIPSNFSDIPGDIMAFDWAFFSMCLLSGVKAVYSQKTRTYYRQHENNIASLILQSEERTLKGVQIKRNHYRFMAHLNSEYDELSDKFVQLYDRLISEKGLMAEYTIRVKQKNIKHPIWWETILPVEELL
jgi:glycosyltransferase involved in cell wall biosynthesis